MRKLLIFSSRGELSLDDWEHYLYDTEASRAEFLDMDPIRPQTLKLGGGNAHYSEWDIALKESESEYQYWHLLFEDDEHVFAYDDPFLEKMCSGFWRAVKGTKASIRVVYHKDKRSLLVIRMTTELSERVSSHLHDLVALLDTGQYDEEAAKGFRLEKEYLHEDIESESSK